MREHYLPLDGKFPDAPQSKLPQRVFKVSYLEWRDDNLWASGSGNHKTKRVKGTTQRDAANKLRASLVGQAIEITAVSDEGCIDVE